MNPIRTILVSFQCKQMKTSVLLSLYFCSCPIQKEKKKKALIFHFFLPVVLPEAGVKWPALPPSLSGVMLFQTRENLWSPAQQEHDRITELSNQLFCQHLSGSLRSKLLPPKSAPAAQADRAHTLPCSGSEVLARSVSHGEIIPFLWGTFKDLLL